MIKKACIKWIRNWFKDNGNGCKAIIGISGGLDSSVVAALCVEALGNDRVLGVLMPNGEQADIECARQLVNHLDIKSIEINIEEAVNGVLNGIKYGIYDGFVQGNGGLEISEQTMINLPPRIRMSTLYAVSQSNNGRVANTCNLSEDWVGYNTRYGDSVGDFAPLADLTKTEIRELGKELNLPNNLVNKVPTDGLCGKTDEDRFGFTYDVLDRYIRTGECEDNDVKTKIDKMHEKNKFKLEPMPKFEIK